MNRVRLALTGVILSCCTSCTVPVATELQRTGNSRRPENGSIVSRDFTAQPAGAPLEQLTISGESITATDMWRDVGDELSEEISNRPPETRRRHIEQRAAKWITDKMAEVLLYKQASLRISTEASANIDRYVDREIRKTVTEKYGGVQRRYEKDLTSKGRTMDDVRAHLRREIVVLTYLETEMKPKIAEPTRAELLAVYDAQLELWRRPPRRHRRSRPPRRPGGSRRGTARRA